MAYETSGPLDQADKIYSALSAFYKACAEKVSTGGEFPQVSDIATQLDYSELHRYATEMSLNSANFPTGSAIETTHLAAAVLREYALRTRSKIEGYVAALEYNNTEADYYDSLRLMHLGMMQGNYVNGSLS